MKLEMEALKLIQKQDGKLSWFQLERALSSHPDAKNGLLMSTLHQLEQIGLIRGDVTASVSRPIYWITEQGKRLLIKRLEQDRIAPKLVEGAGTKLRE